MPGESEASAAREKTAQIVSAYPRPHKVSGEQLPTLISEVYQALGTLGKAPEPERERTPAVPIRRSVQKDSASISIVVGKAACCAVT